MFCNNRKREPSKVKTNSPMPFSRNNQTSPQVYARIAGFLYLINIATGMFGELFVRAKLVTGNAAATADNILAHAHLWRIGIAGDLLMQVTDLPIMLIFYILLKPVNKNLALLALLFDLIQTAVLVANKLNLFTAMFLINGGSNLSAIDPHQLHALAYLYITLHEYGFGVGLIFFGFECLFTGYLIFKSGYLPKALGIMIQVAGLCYLTNSFAMVVAPKFANTMILAPAFIAELSFCLWLLIKGVNVEKWNERLQINAANAAI